jgi:hypothetical protein
MQNAECNQWSLQILLDKAAVKEEWKRASGWIGQTDQMVGGSKNVAVSEYQLQNNIDFLYVY